MKYGDMSARDKEILRLAKRRAEHIFSFFTESAVSYHVSNLKKDPHFQYDGLSSFIIHNLRAIKIRDIDEKFGLKAASEFAQHSKTKTT